MLLLSALACHPKSIPADPGDDTAEPIDSVGSDDSTAVEPVFERVGNPSCLAVARPTSTATVALRPVFTGLAFSHPVALLQASDDAARWWVVSQDGEIQVFVGDDATTTVTALDLSDRVSTEAINEDGLLGMAFHPDFARNGYAYVNYTTGSAGAGTLTSVVSRFHSDDGVSFDPASETVLLTVAQPYSNHNGGNLAFGPDGRLYVGFGDGGSAGDPFGNGQDTSSLLGKMLRLDVDAGEPYAIPDDNPFADGTAGEPEIYAWGLRNPWRWSFDRASGELWAADVGQNLWEEIDRIELGGNYGWNAREGSNCYQSDSCEGDYVDPVYEYPHSVGQSVLGGYVYRGSAIPELEGRYVFADSYAGTVWSLGFDAVTGEVEVTTLAEDTGIFGASFAEGEDGELYLLDYASGGIFRLDQAGEGTPSDFPTTLSATGCVDPTDPELAAPGLVPYDVNLPLWSDGAEKERWFAIPDGTSITVQADGTWTFPVGSVLMKRFSLAGRPVETRLLMLHDDGNWSGYSYAWDEAGTDATLLVSSAATDVDGQTWAFPSRAQCLECHTAGAGRVLGLRTEQLNRTFTHPNGATGNQLELLDAAGFFTTSPGAGADLPSLPTVDGDEPVDARARAYLAANCAMCHLPGGTGGGPLDLRYDTLLAETGACDEAPLTGDLGVDDARILAPGDPERSVLSLRMQTRDVHGMPPLGSSVVDDEGTGVIDSWITTLTCP